MNQDKTQHFAQKLQEDFPDLAIDAVKVIGTGWHHDAVEVNGSIVFRIPHHTYGQDITPETVRYETELLKILKNKLPVNIPDPLYIAPDKTYFGYPKLDGVLLQDIVTTFNDTDWRQLKTDWVAIASIIHTSVSIEVARSLKIPDFEQPGPSAAERILELPEIENRIKDFARQILAQRKAYDSAPGPYIVLHNDLQFHNMLVDPQTKRITGLIDWTDICIGPLAREFSIAEWMPGDLLSEVADLYQAKTGKSVDVQQARMWRSLEELGDYVEETEAGELAEAAKTLERIRHLI